MRAPPGRPWRTPRTWPARTGTGPRPRRRSPPTPRPAPSTARCRTRRCRWRPAPTTTGRDRWPPPPAPSPPTRRAAPARPAPSSGEAAPGLARAGVPPTTEARTATARTIRTMIRAAMPTSLPTGTPRRRGDGVSGGLRGCRVGRRCARVAGSSPPRRAPATRAPGRSGVDGVRRRHGRVDGGEDEGAVRARGRRPAESTQCPGSHPSPSFTSPARAPRRSNSTPSKNRAQMACSPGTGSGRCGPPPS